MNSKNRVLLMIVMLGFCSITSFGQSTPFATNQRYAFPHNAAIPYDYYMQNLYFNSAIYGIGFYKNGSPAQLIMSLGSTGNVGIGIDNPSDKLEVAGNISMNSGNRITFGRAGTGTGDFITNSLNLSVGNGLALGTSGYARVVINASGSVGIGTYAPASLLDVAGDVNITGFGRLITTAANGHIFTSGATANIYTTSGKMGVGVVPNGGTEKLEVSGNIKTSGTGMIITSGTDGRILTTGANASIVTAGAGAKIYTAGANSHIYTLAGKIGIGVEPSGITKELEVIGTMRSTGLIVNGVASILSNPANAGKVISPTQANGKKYSLFVDYGVVSEDFVLAGVSTWADFVFEKNYKLRPLNDVENYITENNHLPEVPTLDDVKKGYGVHDMNTIFLQKIEELTLYAIEQNKKIESLVAEIEELKKK